MELSKVVRIKGGPEKKKLLMRGESRGLKRGISFEGGEGGATKYLHEHDAQIG